MNSRAKFWIVFCLNALAFVILAVLGFKSAGFFLLTTVLWWNKDHALEYKKERVTIHYNTLKAMFETRGKLETYKKVITVFYYVALGMGVVGVLIDLF